jgi:hypothetical protein
MPPQISQTLLRKESPVRSAGLSCLPEYVRDSSGLAKCAGIASTPFSMGIFGDVLAKPFVGNFRKGAVGFQ